MPMAAWLHKYPQVQALLQQDEDELLGASVEEAPAPDVSLAHLVGWGCPVSIPPPPSWGQHWVVADPPPGDVHAAFLTELRARYLASSARLRCRIPPSWLARLVGDTPVMPWSVSALPARQATGWLYGVEIVVDPTVPRWQFDEAG